MSARGHVVRTLLCLWLAACDHLPGCVEDEEVGNGGNCQHICAQLNACELLPSPLGEDETECVRRCMRSSQPDDAGRAQDAGGIYAGVDTCAATDASVANLCGSGCEKLATCLNQEVVAMLDLSGRGPLDVIVELEAPRPDPDAMAAPTGAVAGAPACNPSSLVADQCRGMEPSCIVERACPNRVEQFYLELNAQGVLHRTTPMACRDFFFSTERERRRHQFEGLPAGPVALTVRTVKAVAINRIAVNDLDAGTERALEGTAPIDLDAIETAACTQLTDAFHASVGAARARQVVLPVPEAALERPVGSEQACGFEWTPVVISFDAGTMHGP